MALIKCRDCGQLVSDRAERCPKCGCPIVLSAMESEVEQEEEASAEVPEAGYEYETEESAGRRKYWIMASVVVVVLAAVGLWSIRGKSESPKADDIVEITPEFIEKISAYDNLTNFSEGLAAVCRNDKYGYINTKGDEVIPCRYDMAENFCNGFAVVQNDYGMGYINTEGDSITPCQYDSAKPFSEERAAVCKDGKWGYINTEGEEVIPCTYSQIEVSYIPGKFAEGVACEVVNEDGLAVFIKPDGKEIPELSNRFYVKKSPIGNYVAPAFVNGVCGGLCSSPGSSGGETIAIDKAGNILDSERNDVWEAAFYERSLADTLYKDNSTAYIRHAVDNGELLLLGIRDAYGNEVIKPKYHILGHFSNGVALVGFVVKQLPGMRFSMVLGYMDMKGNDTFSYVSKEMAAKAEDGVSDAEMAGFESGVRAVSYHAESEWSVSYEFAQDGMLSSYGYWDTGDNETYTFVNGALVCSTSCISGGYDSEEEKENAYAYYYKKVDDDHVVVYRKDMVSLERTKFADILYDGQGRIKSVNGTVMTYGSDGKPHDNEGGLVTADLAVIGRNIVDFRKFHRTMYGNEPAWANDDYEYLDIKNW